MAGKTVGFTRRVSLENVQDDWTDECYVLVTLASSREKAEVQDFGREEGHTNVEANAKMLDQVKNHFLKGRIMTLDDTGQLSVSDMIVEHLESFPEAVLFDVWGAVNGYSFDPKDIEAATKTAESSGSEPTPATNEQPSSDQSTDPTSSTEAQPTPQS